MEGPNQKTSTTARRNFTWEQNRTIVSTLMVGFLDLQIIFADNFNVDRMTALWLTFTHSKYRKVSQLWHLSHSSPSVPLHSNLRYLSVSFWLTIWTRRRDQKANETKEDLRMKKRWRYSATYCFPSHLVVPCIRCAIFWNTSPPKSSRVAPSLLIKCDLLFRNFRLLFLRSLRF